MIIDKDNFVLKVFLGFEVVGGRFLVFRYDLARTWSKGLKFTWIKTD